MDLEIKISMQRATEAALKIVMLSYPGWAKNLLVQQISRQN